MSYGGVVHAFARHAFSRRIQKLWRISTWTLIKQLSCQIKCFLSLPAPLPPSISRHLFLSLGSSWLVSQYSIHHHSKNRPSTLPQTVNMSRNFIEDTAEVDDDENEDSFDEETGEVRERSNRDRKHFDDSSEDDDDDDDEEAAAEVQFYSALLLFVYLSLTCTRSPKASLSMKTKTKMMLPGARENANAGNDDEKNVTEKTKTSTKRISNSSV